MEIRKNKKWEKFLKREHIQKQVEIKEPQKRDSNRKSYAKVLMNTLTAKEQITDTDSQFSPLALDDRNVIDHRSQKGKNLIKAASP